MRIHGSSLYIYRVYFHCLEVLQSKAPEKAAVIGEAVANPGAESLTLGLVDAEQPQIAKKTALYFAVQKPVFAVYDASPGGEGG